jgi:diguanylate cyclase (GGDEF)-like protein
MPLGIREKINTVLMSQQPLSSVFCQEKCTQLVIIPLLSPKGEIGVIALTASLVDLLYSMKRTLKNDVAIVQVNQQSNKNIINVISASNAKLINEILPNNSINNNKINELSRMTKQQYQVGEQHYLVNLLPLAVSEQASYYLILVNDVTRFKIAKDNYLQQLILSVFTLAILLVVLIYLLVSPFAQRLLILSNALPLLAKKEFKAFRQMKLKRKHLCPDELDILAESAIELSYELEQLNLVVEQKTQELENIAMYDLLTGLPNRNMLNYNLARTLSLLTNKNNGIALLFLDLDDFKKVNDSYGHAEGDQLLIEAAKRINNNLHTRDMLCRFGGDEFVVFLDEINSLAEVESIAEKILQHFKEPIKIGAHLFYVSISIGIAYVEENIVNSDDLIRQADIAMYEAKRAGGGRYFIYHDSMLLKITQQVYLESEVRQALEKNQFSLSLQPQISAKDQKLYGFEALLRWHHPERGMVTPDEFLPILEKSEYMIELGYWVIRHCFELMAQLRAHGLYETKIAINLSAGQFMDPALTNYLNNLVAEFDIDAHYFELELTEQSLVKDIDLAISVMKKLKKIGFTFAIDDFGTGYSSLAYLKNMPVDVIKIDKSFIFGMLENNDDYKIINSIIAMVKSLGLLTIAEGVETSAQLRSLRQLECDYIQGYYYAKPIPEVELFDFINDKVDSGYWKVRVDKAF